jgi:mannosyltransferase OCH1-like enzyme
MIEKNLHHIWVGPLPPPLKWMNTWKNNHPDWNYILWDNEKVFSRKWKCQEQIEFYKNKGIWHGVADLIRYEILFEFGGFMPGADSECLRKIDELFENDFELFAVSTKANVKDWAREDGKPIVELPIFLNQPEESRPIAPIYAAKKGNEFVGKLIETLSKKKVLREPWKTTGNVFCMEMVRDHQPEIMIFPMHYFLPYHPRTYGTPVPYKYIGTDKVYATHKWGTTRKCYNEGR